MSEQLNKEMEELEESEVTETEEVTEADKSTAKVTKHSGEDDAKKNPDMAKDVKIMEERQEQLYNKINKTCSRKTAKGDNFT